MKNLQTAYTTSDPTLQTKIAADEAAIVKDGGPAMPPGGGMMAACQACFELLTVDREVVYRSQR